MPNHEVERKEVIKIVNRVSHKENVVLRLILPEVLPISMKELTLTDHCFLLQRLKLFKALFDELQSNKVKHFSVEILKDNFPCISIQT
jgi:hypothetical protein